MVTHSGAGVAVGGGQGAIEQPIAYVFAERDLLVSSGLCLGRS